jgi:hypothetical protein
MTGRTAATMSYAELPNKLKIYPDSAHGFLFQYHAEFAGDVDEFLAGPA